MTTINQLTILQAAAALPYGELRILIALTTKPNLTREEIADQVGLSPDYLTSILPSMCRKNIIARRFRVIGDDQVKSIYLPHPQLRYEAIAAEYLATMPGAGMSTNCPNELAGTDNGCQVSLNTKEV